MVNNKIVEEMSAGIGGMIEQFKTQQSNWTNLFGRIEIDNKSIFKSIRGAWLLQAIATQQTLFEKEFRNINLDAFFTELNIPTKILYNSEKIYDENVFIYTAGAETLFITDGMDELCLFTFSKSMIEQVSQVAGNNKETNE